MVVRAIAVDVIDGVACARGRTEERATDEVVDASVGPAHDLVARSVGAAESDVAELRFDTPFVGYRVAVDQTPHFSLEVGDIDEAEDVPIARALLQAATP